MKLYVIVITLVLGLVTAANAFNGDILLMRKGDPWPEVYYENSLDQSSAPIVGHRLEIDGVIVTVWVSLNKGPGGAERITVIPEDDQLIAIPPEADVIDGESVIIIIMPPMF